MNQEKVWDKIAEKWNLFRETPSPTTKDFLKDKKGKILDLGCGSGRNFPAFNKDSSVYALDFSEQMLKHAKEKAKRLGVNASFFHSGTDNLKFEDNEFDSIICIAVLHCIPEKKARIDTLREIYRTLKPGSQVLISVWGRKSPRLKDKPKECYVPWTIRGEDKQERFTYIYDKDELEKEVKSAGLKIIQSWEERNINIVAEK
jgi:ubiquinone/menaquinone biosynthesis C-methylase UbiE